MRCGMETSPELEAGACRPRRGQPPPPPPPLLLPAAATAPARYGSPPPPRPPARRPFLQFPPPPPYPPPPRDDAAALTPSSAPTPGPRLSQPPPPPPRTPSPTPEEYSYAYYEPDCNARVLHTPQDRHSFTTRYGTEENIYEEISEVAAKMAAAAAASASASASSSSPPPSLGSPTASLRLQPRHQLHHHHHHQHQRARALDHDLCQGHGRGGACRNSSGASRSLASIAQSVVEEEVRRVEHGHKRVLGELNLSVEAMLMPPSVVPPPDLLDELLAVGPTDDLLTPASPTHGHAHAHEADSGLGSYYSGASSSRSSASFPRPQQPPPQQQQGGFWKRRGWKRITGLAAGKRNAEHSARSGGVPCAPVAAGRCTMPGHAPRDLASPLPFDEPRVGSGSWEERAAPVPGPVARPDDSCWLSASDGDLSSGDESERSSNKSNGQARATLGSKARTLCDKWRGRPSATLPAAGGSSGPLVSEAAPEAVAVPGGRLSRWFSIRRGSTHQYDVDTGGGSGGSCERVPTPNKMPLLPEVEEENGTTFAAFGRRQMPPTLPPPPHGLTPEQLKRRHIVAAIVHSENSYVATLHRLVNDYKKPLEESTPPILSPAKIQTLFLRLPEILQCHTLFRIALAECVRSWDRDERIGDVFVASFSKAVVLEIYSDFINNFSSAMDLAKMEAKRKSALADFFKVKQISAHDRLSFFGLMVKPVQRFPQFILFLQDLLKHTPQGHHDRMSLQLALTQLESLAEMLNERKREAEQFQAFKEMMRHISGRFAARSRPDGHRYLLREDNVTQLEFNQAGMITKSKSRRLLLLNDMVVCVSVTPKTTDDFSGSERLSLKWSYPVTDIEVVDTSTSPTLSRLLAAGLNRGGSLKSDRSSTSLDSNMSGGGAADNLCAEMNDLMHDYEVVSRIADLVSSLKGNYKDLNVPGIRRILSDIQGSIQQKDEEMAWVDSCCLQLAVKTKGKEETFTFQTDNPSVKKEWITELRLAQLALDPNNSPAWEVPEQERRPSTKMPLFVRAQPVYRSQHETEVRCGCFYSAGSLAATRDHRSSRRGRRPASYLWVCTTDGASSHVAVLAQPQQQAAQLREVTAFDLVETRVTAVEFVRGCPDAVWMGTDSRRLVLYKASEPERQEEVGSVVVPEVVIQIRAHGESVFVALADGTLQRFRKAADDTWLLREPQTLSLGMDPVSSLLPINSCLYAACGKKVWVLGPSGDVQKNFSVQHEHVGSVNLMAHSGIGLWISLKNSSTICLYHTETFKHLQDINIASNIACLPRGSGNGGPVTVTALMACKGLLWVGTDAGVCLTVPLPRLEGVPIISGRVNISYHAHFGPISFLLALQPRSNKEFAHQEPQNQQSPASVGGGDLSSETSSSSSAVRNDVHLGSPVVLRRRRPRDIDPLTRGSKTLPRGLGGGSAASSASGDGCDVYGLYGELMYVRDYEGEGRAGTGGVTDGGVGGTATDAGYGSLRRSDPELAAVPGRVSTLDRRLLLAAGRPRSLDLSSWSVDSRASTSSGSEDASRPVDNLVQCPPTPIPLPPDPEPRQQPPPHDPSAVPRRTVVTLMGGRGYVNWRQQGKGGPEPNNNDAHIVIWEMKL